VEHRGRLGNLPSHFYWRDNAPKGATAMTFIRTKIVNGRTYRSLEERYREGDKVKSRYIKSLGTSGYWSDRTTNEPVGVHDAMVETFERQQAQEKARAEKSTSEAPAAESGHENAASEKDSGEDSGAA
jgi:hypothetical protein